MQLCMYCLLDSILRTGVDSRDNIAAERENQQNKTCTVNLRQPEDPIQVDAGQ